MVMDDIIKDKQGSTLDRYLTALKDPAYKLIEKKLLVETLPADFMEVLRAGTTSTNVHLRRFQNHAVDMDWLTKRALPKKKFPKLVYGEQRAITRDEHRRSRPDRVRFTNDARNSMACLRVPSVRNGHLTQQMLDFLGAADACLLNINLYPTLPVAERRQVAESLKPFLSKAVISISFSRGFALTASQLGVVLIHQDHPLRKKYEAQWNWFSYFFNAVAARAFMNLDLAEIGAVDDKRRQWVLDDVAARGLPVVDSGSYYVKSFQVEGQPPSAYFSLVRDGLLRLCFNPPQT
jgi:hypothetical protein